MLSHADILSLLMRRASDRSLERPFYTDPGVYQADLENIFYQSWLFVAPTCDIPKAGNYVTYDVGDHTVIVVRGRDGAVRAFHNSCPHRGSVLCKGAKGSTANLVCPYHQWTFDLEGKLLFAKRMSEDFDPRQHGLKLVHCRVVKGLIYICLAEDAPDIAPFAHHLATYLAPHDVENSKVAFESRIIEKANWKLVWENNRECYHCAGTHPALCRSFPEDASVIGNVSGGTLAPGLASHVARCEAVGAPSGFTMETDGSWRFVRIPITGESYTMNGKAAVTKPNSSFPFKDAGALLKYHYPSTWNHFLGDHILLFRVTPIGPMETEVCTRWLVHKDAEEGRDYDLERLTEVWLATNEEDRQIVEGNQRGILSPIYQPGPHSEEDELGVRQFLDWYACLLSQGLSGDTNLKAAE